MSNMNKIAIDLDDTLVPTVEMLVKEMFKDKKFSLFKGYHSISNLSFEEKGLLYIYIRQTINKQDIEDFKPIEDSVSVIKKLAKEYELYIVTARNHDVKDHTQKWVNKYFPKCFKEIIFSKYHRPEKFFKTKGEICKEKGIDLIIDDNYEHIIDCNKYNIKTIVFNHNNKYAWSKGKYPKATKVAYSWKDVEKILNI